MSSAISNDYLVSARNSIQSAVWNDGLGALVFQQDDASVHWATNVKNLLNAQRANRWIGGVHSQLDRA